jgi:hypothetical protein
LSATDALVAQVLASRTRTFKPDDKVSITYTLPSQFRMGRLFRAMVAEDGDQLIDLLLPILKEWTGVTHATLLGAGVGSDDPAPLTPETARAFLSDRVEVTLDLASDAAKQSHETSKRSLEQSGN